MTDMIVGLSVSETADFLYFHTQEPRVFLILEVHSC